MDDGLLKKCRGLYQRATHPDTTVDEARTSALLLVKLLEKHKILEPVLEIDKINGPSHNGHGSNGSSDRKTYYQPPTRHHDKYYYGYSGYCTLGCNPKHGHHPTCYRYERERHPYCVKVKKCSKEKGHCKDCAHFGGDWY